MTSSTESRRPLLFIHGAFCGPEVWESFIAPWFRRRGHEVALAHLPEADEAERGMEDYVAAARAAAKGMSAPPVLIGYSFGGLVAQAMMAESRYPGVALVASPSPFGLSASFAHMIARNPQVVVDFVQAQAGFGALLGVESTRRALFTDETPDHWIRTVTPRPRRESPDALIQGLLFGAPLWWLSLGTPVLAIAGDEDAFVHPIELIWIAMAYGARTELLKGLGHGLTLDPSWRAVADRLENWIAGL